MSKAGLPLWSLQADAAEAVRPPQLFVISLFQRPYVWKEDEQ